MQTRRLSWIGFAVLGLLFTLQSSRRIFAQDQDDQDPPTRVARLNYSSGSVSFQPSGEGDWVTAVPNRPLTTGDNLWADQNSRAELHIGSTAIRMNSETSLTFLDLDDHNTQLRLSLGSILLRVRHLDDGDLLEVDTPNLAFTVQRTGEYRIDVNADGNQTITTVWRGRGEATGGGYSFTVVAGQQASFNGTDELDHQIEQVPGNDDFDQWAFQRDTREDGDESSNYISSEMTGYEDLDDYGHWRYVADYGPVWTPIGVAPGWAPYRFGHWVWVAPWGWTWVEDEPWGFAPFHYGRWAFVENDWCWVPGPVYVRPVYAPALVAFVGGGGFRLSVGVGEGVAWFPLGPREVYVPPYRVSRTYVNNVNITNTRVNSTQVTNVYNNYTTNNVTRITYVNQRVPTAVTAVSHETFVNARPVARNLAQVDARQLAEAPVSHMAPIQPERTSVVGAGVLAKARPPAAIENRHVVATRNPTPPRAPFEQRRAVNVRTETPGQASPRPEAPVVKTGPDEHRNIPRPSEPGRPQESQASRQQETPRPEMPRTEPQPAPRPSPGYQNRGSEGPTHPLVRPAPPVESRPQVEQNEASKFRNWQQQRPSAPRANVPRPPDNHAPQKPQKEERKK
jgi:hypothetical protein